MATLKVGDKAPDFALKDQNGKTISLGELKGKKNLVIYFYPKDETPGCTAEACSFRDQYEDFRDANAEVIGISQDSVASHKNFSTSRKLPFILLSDPDNTIRQLYGVPSSFLGLMPGRVTYVVDKHGTVKHVFNSQIQAKKHVSEALNILRSL